MTAMAQSTVWMLLTAGQASAKAIPLRAGIAVGTRGEALRRVDVGDGGADIRDSALLGAGLMYDLLYREKYIDRRVMVNFEADESLTNVHGRSADLAFALAFAAGVYDTQSGSCLHLPPVAATGALNAEGAILAIENAPQKIACAIAALPIGATVVFPEANLAELSSDLHRKASERQIALVSATRVDEVLQRLGVPLSAAWQGSPFRGLEPFEFEHAAIFFGREREIEELIDLLRSQVANARSLLIEGPSGAGKSSLVLAGLLPALLRRGLPEQTPKTFRWGVLRPYDVRADANVETEQAALWEALVSALPGESASAPSTPNPSNIWTWLRASNEGSDDLQLVLVLDQLEDWFDGRLQVSTIERFVSLIVALSQRGLWLVATIAKSASTRLSRHPKLDACFGVQGRYALEQQLDAERVETVIRAPARAARLTFEPGLESRIFAAATSGGVDVLPLLELLLTELYERRDVGKNVLRLDDFDQVGGLEGVIGARAEAAFNKASPEEQIEISQVLWKLETAGTLVLSDYPPAEPIHGLIAAFRKKRLLVEDRGVSGDASVRVAHQALLRHWRRAADFRHTTASDIQTWTDLMREAGQWAQKSRALIPSGPQMANAWNIYRRHLSYWKSSDALVVEYVNRSHAQHQRRRFLTAFAIGAPAVAAAAVGGTALVRYFNGLHETIVAFDDISVPPPDYAIAAAPYLQRFGIYLLSRSPDDSHVQIRSNAGIYGGEAANPFSGEHFMTQQAEPPTAPVSFVLDFQRPPRAVGIQRAGLWAATSSGVSHPAWSAHAFDASGTQIASVSEDTSAAFNRGEQIPDKEYVLRGSPGLTISQLEVISDFRNADGVPYAGFQGVLIKALRLIY